MNSWVVVTLVILAFVGGALAHEADIRQTIRQEGNSGYAGWLGKIEGRIVD